MPLRQKKIIFKKEIHQHAGKVCANCGLQSPADNQFCPQCGQKFHDLDISISHLTGEAIEGFLHLDNKSYQTVWKLVCSPGFLTSEFIKGRRVRYVAPIRLYILISFIFFLLLGLPDRKSDIKKENDITGISITFYGINSLDLRGFTPAQIDSVMLKNKLKPNMFNTYMVNQLMRIGSGGKEEFSHLLMKAVSYMMFALMPVFALFIYILYRKKEYRYIDALIFSVHYHCFIFITLIFYMLLNRFIDVSQLFVVILVIIPIYLFWAFRYMYGSSRIITFLKILIIGLLQFASMAILFILTTLISLILF
jgi:hypothetical protein